MDLPVKASDFLAITKTKKIEKRLENLKSMVTT